jgi:hypothetical protein
MTWSVYRIAAKLQLVGYVEAKDEKDALKKAEEEHTQLKGKLVVRRFD